MIVDNQRTLEARIRHQIQYYLAQERESLASKYQNFAQGWRQKAQLLNRHLKEAGLPVELPDQAYSPFLHQSQLEITVRNEIRSKRQSADHAVSSELFNEAYMLDAEVEMLNRLLRQSDLAEEFP